MSVIPGKVIGRVNLIISIDMESCSQALFLMLGIIFKTSSGVVVSTTNYLLITSFSLKNCKI